MLGHGILKYFRPITHKKDTPEDKDPPEGKELCNLFGSYLSKAIPLSLWSIASCNTDVTSVLKHAKCSLTKNCYTYKASAEIWNLQVLKSREHMHCNSAIIFYQHKQNLTQFVKVLLVKLSDMFHSSNFIRLFHRQSFTLYGMLLNFGILIEMSYEAYSILLSQVIATLIYQPCRVALPGLANRSASL